MGRWARIEDIQGNTKYCKDTITGTYYPASPCPPTGASRRAMKAKLAASKPALRNFLGGMITKEDMLPTLVGAGAGVFGGHLASKKIKIGFLGKWNRPVMMIAGGLLGIAAGKMVARKMEAMNVTTIVEDTTVAPTDVNLEVK